jgi:hypothetical protein
MFRSVRSTAFCLITLSIRSVNKERASELSPKQLRAFTQISKGPN